MCGIVGILGTTPVAPLLIDALRRLEYRGYDSAGIATLKSDDTPDTVLARADDALYRAKAQGRNRIAIASADHPFFEDEEAAAG